MAALNQTSNVTHRLIILLPCLGAPLQLRPVPQATIRHATPQPAGWENTMQCNVNDDGFMIISADKALIAAMGTPEPPPAEPPLAGQAIKGTFAVDMTIDAIVK